MGKLRTEKYVADILGVLPRTLRSWRSHRRDGPPYIVVTGKVIRYDEDELEKWIRARPQGGMLSRPMPNPNRRSKKAA
jgi:hypothetical protein